MKRFLFSLICSVAIAAATPVTVTYVNAGTPSQADSQGTYVGPYTLNINGQSVKAMCMDDFYNVSGTWTANVTAVNSSDLSNTYLGGNHNYTVGSHTYTTSQVYTAEAYLFSQLIQPGADRTTIQDAAWTFMDEVLGMTPHSNSAAVNNMVNNLYTNLATFNSSSYAIVSQTGRNHTEQEFIVATPEPGTWSLLLMGSALACVGVFFNRSRRAVEAKK